MMIIKKHHPYFRWIFEKKNVFFKILIFSLPCRSFKAIKRIFTRSRSEHNLPLGPKKTERYTCDSWVISSSTALYSLLYQITSSSYSFCNIIWGGDFCLPFQISWSHANKKRNINSKNVIADNPFLGNILYSFHVLLGLFQ